MYLVLCPHKNFCQLGMWGKRNVSLTSVQLKKVFRGKKKQNKGTKQKKNQNKTPKQLKERKLCSDWPCPCTMTCITCGPSVVKKCAKKDMDKPPHSSLGSSLKWLIFRSKVGKGRGGNHLCFPHHSFIATSFNLKKGADSENCVI